MEVNMTFLGLAKKVLEEAGRPLTGREIWEMAREKRYDERINSRGKTPWNTIESRIYVSMKEDPDSPFVKIDGSPRRFYLKHLLPLPETLEKMISKEPTIIRKRHFDLLEKELHPYLSYYAYHYLYCYTKSINHLQSTKKSLGSGYILTWSDVIFPWRSGSQKCMN